MPPLNQKLPLLIKQVESEILNGEFTPYQSAIKAAELLTNIIKLSRAQSQPDILEEVLKFSKVIIAIDPHNHIINNICCRAIDIIKTSNNYSPVPHAGLVSMVNAVDKTPKSSKVGKCEIIQEMMELMNEIKDSQNSISGLSVDHIHSREIILTFGHSEMVLNFLGEAAKFRRFEVFVAESAPAYDGRKSALELTKRSIDTTLIPDASVFAMMSRINKVIMTANSAFASGSLLAQIGAKNIVSSARHHAVPVVVLLELHKLSPVDMTEFVSPKVYSNPEQILSYTEPVAGGVSVLNPKFDWVPFDYVDLFVTSLGGFMPQNIYRVLNDLYYSEEKSL